MRKILFWIIITIFLFLVVLLGIAFYKDRTPLSVLRQRFWAEEVIVVQSQDASEQQKQVDTTEEIKETVSDEWWPTSFSSSTWSTGNNSSTALTEEDKKAMRSIVDWLIVK